MTYQEALNIIVICAMTILTITLIFGLIKSVIGPRMTDRLMNSNMVSTQGLILIVFVCVYLQEAYLVDVAIVYAMVGFFGTIVFAKYVLEHSKKKASVKKKKEEVKMNVND